MIPSGRSSNKALHKELRGQDPLVEIVPPLLAWYEKSARVLPWRENPEPYRVWVSEIMLQQTRVEAVKPYYDRFLQALPDIPALARADEEQLMKLWEGLGYYSRVRNLQKAARLVMEQYGGVLPRSPEALMCLPGVGEYTAGAIASIAYGVPAPAVDGNVLRVVARVLSSREDVTQAGVKREWTRRLGGIIPAGRAGDFTQAMMELGALVCAPNGPPHCEACPLCGLCKAWLEGVETELPVKAPKKQRRIEDKTVFVLLCGGRVALSRRPQKGVLAGMWELPGTAGALSPREATEFLEGWGAVPGQMIPLGGAKHIFTHLEWHMMGYAVRLQHTICGKALEWATKDDLLERFALPAAFRKFREKALELLDPQDEEN
jgi:A/G-specific adenine glycosylase